MTSVLVTGAGRGIGLAITRHLSERGWDVYATARSTDDLRDLASVRNVHAVALDITDRAAVARLHEQLPSQPDGVVNNAGIIVQGPVETVPLDDLSQQLEVTSRASIALSRRASRSVATGATTSAAPSLHWCRRPRRPSATPCSLPPPQPEEFSVNDNSNSAVITSYAQAATRTITVGDTTYAYRELGPKGGIPVVFFVHLAATLDNWDPRIVDPIAQSRQVITFDQRGVGASTGKVPNTIEQAADHAYEFIAALGFEKIDVFSFSMGGMIAQDLIVKHPDLVRRLVLTGTGPRGGKNMDKVVGVTYWDILRATLTRSDPKEFLFFNRNATGKSAGTAFVKRLQERTLDRDQEISIKALRTQLKAIQKFGRSAPSDLSTFTQPTLIANGDHDRMVPSVLSEDLHRRIKGSELIIYPNSGHGGIFQFHEKFAPVAARFLAD